MDRRAGLHGITRASVERLGALSCQYALIVLQQIRCMKRFSITTPRSYHSEDLEAYPFVCLQMKLPSCPSLDVFGHSVGLAWSSAESAYFAVLFEPLLCRQSILSSVHNLISHGTHSLERLLV